MGAKERLNVRADILPGRLGVGLLADLLARSNQENAACAKEQQSMARPVQPSGVFLGVKADFPGRFGSQGSEFADGVEQSLRKGLSLCFFEKLTKPAERPRIATNSIKQY